MGLFNSYSAIEEELLEHYSKMFATMGMPDGRKSAKEILDRSIEKSKQERTYNLPLNLGNILLDEEEAEDPVVEKLVEVIKRTLQKKRDEGVRDEDIKWWWNLNDVERQIMLAVDEMNRLSLFMHNIKTSTESSKEKTAEKASRRVWKFHPMYTYGDTGERNSSIPEWIHGEDLPLPIELKDRVNIYIEKRGKNHAEEFKKDIDTASTFNALVRKEIKAGNI